MADLGSNEVYAKIVVLGHSGVGKTALLHRLVHRRFPVHYSSTDGVQFLFMSMVVDSCAFRVQFWDVPASERFGNKTKVYFQGAHGAIIVFDASRPETLREALLWKHDLDSKTEISIPTILISNKQDLLKSKGKNLSSTAQLKKLCNDNRFVACLNTTAKNRDRAFRAGVKMLLGCILEEAQRSAGCCD